MRCCKTIEEDCNFIEKIGKFALNKRDSWSLRKKRTEKEIKGKKE